jgi:hypothetical protein
MGTVGAACARSDLFARWTAGLKVAPEGTTDAADINDNLSELRTPSCRGHADRCVPVLLRVQRLQNETQALGGRLLRLLFVRLGPVPAGSECRGRAGKQLLCETPVVPPEPDAPPSGREILDANQAAQISERIGYERSQVRPQDC